MRLRPTCLLLVLSALIATLSSGLASASDEASQKTPEIDPRSDLPIDLKFTEPSSVLDIYRAMGKAWGINILFDPKLRDREITFEMIGVTPREGLANVMSTVGHFYTVLDSGSILVADDTPQNRRTYEHQVIQTFFLENTSVPDMMTLVRSLIGAKHVAANEQNNSLVLRDTVDKMQVAEQILRRNDQPRAEVTIDVDLLMIDSQKIRQLGLESAVHSAGAGDATDHLPPRLAHREIERIRRLSSTQALAQPRLNVVDGSRGELHLMDSLPMPAGLVATTKPAMEAAPDGAIYQDVGLEIKIEPRVHSENEVSLELQVEAKTLTDWLEVPGSQARPVFGERNLQASIRLQGGETYLISGLMMTPATSGPEPKGFPFSRFLRRSDDPREVILALTPHIVRGPWADGGDGGPLWIGTEANIAIGDRARATSLLPGPFDRQEGRTSPP